ncbi:MAG: sulfotransferase family protein [Pseudomonadota bacterium]
MASAGQGAGGGAAAPRRSLLRRAASRAKRALLGPPPKPPKARKAPPPPPKRGLAPPRRLTPDGEKVFGIGLSRTGTTSLTEALKLLGYDACHWFDPGLQRLLRLEDAFRYDAICDINASFQFETLASMFPQARFIYTVRPLDGWLASMDVHFEGRGPAQLREDLEAVQAREDAVGIAEQVLDPLYHAMTHGLYSHHASWEAAWHAHDARVRGFFEGRPERLLIFDRAGQGHGWDELCGFLGRPVPDAPYPHRSFKPRTGPRRDLPPRVGGG